MPIQTRDAPVPPAQGENGDAKETKRKEQEDFFPTPQKNALGDFAKLALVVGGTALVAKLLASGSGARTERFVAGRVDNVRALGRAIRQRREDLGLTQEDLAQKSGVGPRFVSEMENGKARAEIAKIFQIVDAIGLKLSLSLREEGR